MDRKGFIFSEIPLWVVVLVFLVVMGIIIVAFREAFFEAIEKIFSSMGP